MKQKIVTVPDGLISELSINGLNGRVLKVPAKKRKYAKQHILAIYGHHSSLERMYGIIENIADYGNVTMPDLPGFGGMDSFDVLGRKPNIDAFADYLATFIKLYYRNKRLSIVGMSFGFVVITRMLQKYPELCNKVDLLVSLVGFSATDDFKFTESNKRLFRNLSLFCGTKFMAPIVRYVFLNTLFIRLGYWSVSKVHPKMKDANLKELRVRTKFEVYLWHLNDVRTHMLSTAEMMKLDITHTKVKHNLLHITVGNDQYFDNKTVKANLKKIFGHVEIIKANLGNHAPTVISDATNSKAFIPKQLRRKLAENLPA